MKRKIRVLYFISYATPLGGAQRSLHATICELKDKIEYLVVIPGKGEAYDLFKDLNVHLDAQGPGINVYGKKLFTYSKLKKLELFFTEYLPYQIRIFRFIKQYKPDIIHSNSGRSILFNYLAFKFCGVKIINHIRGKFNTESKMVKRNFDLPDSLITVSKSIKRDYIYKEHLTKTTPIYNGVDPHLILTDKKVKKYNSQKSITFGCFSNIVPFKGHHHLLGAMKILNSSGYLNKYKVVCLGKFPKGYEYYHKYLEKIISQDSITNIFFEGFQNDPFQYYNTVDVTVLPSISSEKLNIEKKEYNIRGNEGLPRVLLESMVFANPLIASDVEGVHEIIDKGINGFIFQPGSAEQLAEKMKYFIENQPMILKMGFESKRIMEERFHIKHNAEKILNLYESII